MVKLLHLCRITYNLQNQDTPNYFVCICLQVAIVQNDLSVCNRPEKRMTLIAYLGLLPENHRMFRPLQGVNSSIQYWQDSKEI